MTNSENTHIRYGRTFHLPFSPGMSRDDKKIRSLEKFEGQEVVATIKYDGENTTIKRELFHARSPDSRHNFTRTWIKQLHAAIGPEIPDGWRLCGENVSYFHSIEYKNLESFFYLFSVWDEKGQRLHFDEMLEIAEIFDLAVPEVLYRGPFDLKVLEKIAKTFDIVNHEGFVVTTTKGFHHSEFSDYMAKWVRAGHVQPNEEDSVEFWMKNTYPNKLRDPSKVKPSYMPGYLGPK